MDTESIQKVLKNYNLKTANAILMTLATIMYLHETFYLGKYCGKTHRS